MDIDNMVQNSALVRAREGKKDLKFVLHLYVLKMDVTEVKKIYPSLFRTDTCPFEYMLLFFF